MIVWLASYPKSGNTWLRSILGQFFEEDLNEDKVFERSKKIRLYPSNIDYLEIDDVFKSKIYLQEQKKEILDKMNSFFGYSVVEKLKFISFDDGQKNFKNNDVHQENVAINKYQNKINNVKNDKIKKSLIELTKVFKEK